MGKEWDPQSRRYFGSKSELSFEQVVREDVPTIFTVLQHKLLAVYRDGAGENLVAARAMNLSPNTENELKKDIIFRMDRSFGKPKGKERFQRALGVAIIAGWIEPKDNKINTNDLENNVVDLMLYGFSKKEIAQIILMTPGKLKSTVEEIKEHVGVKTDLELVALRASGFRHRLLAARLKNAK